MYVSRSVESTVKFGKWKGEWNYLLKSVGFRIPKNVANFERSKASNC